MSSLTDLLNWHDIALVLSGAVGVQLAGWLSGWFTTNGAKLVNDKLEVFRAELNQSKFFGGLLGQINADDACIKIIEAAIPDVVVTLGEDVQQMMKDGTLTDASKWHAMASSLWAKAEGQITGGAHDYLEHSSFDDGVVLAETILRRFFNKQQVAAPAASVTATVTEQTATNPATISTTATAPVPTQQ